MSAGEETNEAYYDSFELDSSINTVSSTDETKNIHTRVMVEDVNATGYETLSSSIAQNTRFASIDIEKFDKMVKKNLVDEVRAGLFFDQVYSYNDGTGNLIIVAQAGREGVEIARGNSMDPEFNATLAKWGLTIKSPYGRVKYIETSTGEEKEAEIQSLNEYANLCNSSDDWTASLSGGAVTVSNRGTNPITGVTISDQVRAIGNYFLHNCTYLTGALDISHVTSLGTHFLDGCTSFNSPISLVGLGSSGQVPQYFMMGCSSFNSNINLGSVTWVDNGFLVDCVSFNKPLAFNNCSAVGDDFLYNNISFNSDLSFNPDFTWAGENFMYNCASFNKELRVQRLYQVNNGFMQNCISFNRAMYFYEAISIGNDFLSGCTTFDSTLSITAATSVGNSFLANCESFDSQLVVSRVTTIGNDFMRGCSGYSQGVSFISRVTTIGNNFMRGATSFSGQIPLTSAQTIGTGFLYGATSYNYNLTIPSTIQSVGAYFMYNCDSYTSTITFETPASVASANDPYTISSSSSSSDLYTTGVTFEGTYASEWARTFPTRTSPYRTVITALEGVVTMQDNTEIGLYSEDDFARLSATYGQTHAGGTRSATSGVSETFTIGGQTYRYDEVASVNITKTPGNTRFPDYFMYDATNLTSLSYPTTITGTYNAFLGRCTSFNQQLDLSNFTYIGESFLVECFSYNQPITIPSTMTFIGPSFLARCDSLTSSITMNAPIGIFAFSSRASGISVSSTDAPAYTTGVTIAGTYAREWAARFYDSPDGSIGGIRKVAAPAHVGRVTYSKTATTAGGETYTYDTFALIRTSSQLEKLKGSGDIWMVSFDGHTIDSTNIRELIITTATSLPDNYLRNCTNLRSVTLPKTGLTTIGNNFMMGCVNFQQKITIPATLQSIGTNFMTLNTAYNAYAEINCPATAFADSKFSFTTSNSSASHEFYITGPYTDLVAAKFSNGTYTDLSSGATFYRTIVPDGYGIVVLTDGTRVVLQSDEDVLQLSGKDETEGGWYGTWSHTIQGTTVTNYNVREIHLYRSCIEIKSYFASNCRNLQVMDIYYSEITSIPFRFMEYCVVYNAPLYLPRHLLSSKEDFCMLECSAFNNDIYFPDTFRPSSSNYFSLGHWLYDCYNMTGAIHFAATMEKKYIWGRPPYLFDNSTCPAYVTGITIKGPGRTAILQALLENSDYGAYQGSRKFSSSSSRMLYWHLIDGGA